MAGAGALLPTIAAAGPAAGVPTAGSLSISPAVIDTVVQPGASLPPITIRNTTGVTFDVLVFPALVDQKLDGSLVIRESKSQLRAAGRLFAVEPRRLTLPAGAAATVQETFLRTPRGQPAAYGAAVVQATPVRKGGRGPTYRLRLLAALLVRLPTAPPPRGKIIAARIEQAGPRRLRFVARIRNSGRVHGYPQELRLHVLDARSRAVFAAAPRPGVVLPGYRRDYPAVLFRRLRAGRYRLIASARFGLRFSSAVTRFRLVAPNRLRRPRS